MKAMALVAHPDDCVIFAYSFMHNHPEYDWTVCYLTYTADHPRGQELQKFWHQRACNVVFLGFQDQWNHKDNCPGHIDLNLACRAIQAIVADQDLVLTHNAQGEYGHPHHVLVYQCACQHPNLVTFANPGSGTVKYSIDPGVYSLDELPLHRDIIAGFHSTTHTNEYNL